MTDEQLAAQAIGLPTMYFDGFGNYRKINGVIHCTGYVLHLGASLNLVVSITGADAAQIETKRVLNGEPGKSTYDIWRGSALAH